MIIYVFLGTCPSYLGSDGQHKTTQDSERVRQGNLTALKAYI